MTHAPFGNLEQQLRDATETPEWKKMIQGIKDSDTIYVIGNGGNMAVASHAAADITRLTDKPVWCLDSQSLLTSIANDYGYENVFESALKFYADKGDALIAISSSGMSRNILNAVNFANKNGLYVITFSGFNSKNSLKNLGKINFFVESKSYNVVEMTHHIWLVSIVDYLADNRDFEK